MAKPGMPARLHLFRGESLTAEQIAELTGVSISVINRLVRQGKDLTEHVAVCAARIAPCTDLPGEEWRPIAGHAGQEVSILGRVRTSRVRGRDATRRGHWKLIRPFPCQRYGYLKVGLVTDDGTKKQHMVHCLVADAFLGPRPAGMVARHYPDPDKSNCAASNVRWGTHLENARDSQEQGLTANGERSGTAKLSDSDVHAVRTNRGFISAASLAEAFNVTEKHIREIWQRKTRILPTNPFRKTSAEQQVELLSLGGRHG